MLVLAPEQSRTEKNDKRSVDFERWEEPIGYLVGRGCGLLLSSKSCLEMKPITEEQGHENTWAMTSVWMKNKMIASLDSQIPNYLIR